MPTVELPCGHQISEDWLISRAASINAKRAKTGGKREGAGRPVKFINCPRGCGHRAGVAAMRVHLRDCDLRAEIEGLAEQLRALA